MIKACRLTMFMIWISFKTNSYGMVNLGIRLKLYIVIVISKLGFRLGIKNMPIIITITTMAITATTIILTITISETIKSTNTKTRGIIYNY